MISHITISLLPTVTADKSELIWSGFRYNVNQLRSSDPLLQHGIDEIKLSDNVWLFGVTIAVDLGLDMNLVNACKTCLR